MCKALNVEIFETLRAIKEDLRSWRYTLWSCVGDSAVLGWQFPPNCPIDVTPPFTEGNRGWNRQSEMFTFRCLIGGILVRLFHVCFLSQKEGPQVAFLEASWAQFCVFRQPACRTGLLSLWHCLKPGLGPHPALLLLTRDPVSLPTKWGVCRHQNVMSVERVKKK